MKCAAADKRLGGEAGEGACMHVRACAARVYFMLCMHARACACVCRSMYMVDVYGRCLVMGRWPRYASSQLATYTLSRRNQDKRGKSKYFDSSISPTLPTPWGHGLSLRFSFFFFSEKIYFKNTSQLGGRARRAVR